MTSFQSREQGGFHKKWFKSGSFGYVSDGHFERPLGRLIFWLVRWRALNNSKCLVSRYVCLFDLGFMPKEPSCIPNLLGGLRSNPLHNINNIYLLKYSWKLRGGKRDSSSAFWKLRGGKIICPRCHNIPYETSELLRS